MMLWLIVAAAWGSGWFACRSTHRQRGIQVDRWEQIRRPDDDLVSNA